MRHPRYRVCRYRRPSHMLVTLLPSPTCIVSTRLWLLLLYMMTSDSCQLWQLGSFGFTGTFERFSCTGLMLAISELRGPQTFPQDQSFGLRPQLPHEQRAVWPHVPLHGSEPHSERGKLQQSHLRRLRRSAWFEWYHHHWGCLPYDTVLL